MTPITTYSANSKSYKTGIPIVMATFKMTHPRWAEKRVLMRAFFAFGACINAFRYCRPILCVHCTFLNRKYKGQILTAIATNGNNQVLPVAFAFVESENIDSWLWFLRSVKISVAQAHPNVCIIHDRQTGLLNAITNYNKGKPSHFRIDLHSR